MKKSEIGDCSPYEDFLSIKLLEEAFQMKIEESKGVTNKVVNNLLKGNKYKVSPAFEGKEKVRLVVDGSDEFFKDYQDGIIKLAIEKEHVVAQIKENGRYGRNFLLKKINILMDLIR